MEKTEIILNKIIQLQKLVREYSEPSKHRAQHKNAPQQKKHNLPKDQTSKTAKAANKPQNKVPNQGNNKSKETAKKVNSGTHKNSNDLYDRSVFLYKSGKKLRHIHNANLARRFTDLWLTALLQELIKKNDFVQDNKIVDRNISSGKLTESEVNSTSLNTDELINDPEIKAAEELQRSILEGNNSLDLEL